MRVTPTSVDYANIGVYDTNAVTAVSSLSLAGLASEPNMTYIELTTAGGLTQYRPYVVTNNNSASAYIGFSAEL